MSGKAERREAREVVGAYYEAQLEILVTHVGDAIDRHRAGDLDVFEVDRAMFQYSRAAKALWVFCHPTSTTVAGTNRSSRCSTNRRGRAARTGRFMGESRRGDITERPAGRAA